MTVSEFYSYLCEKIPPELTLRGDCDGMSCCPSPERNVARVLIALDVTSDVVDEAIEEGCDVILAHHPMLYGGISDVCAGNFRGDKLIRLIQAGIAGMSFHTRLDAVDGGVSDTLSALIGLKNAEKFGENGICRIGELESPVFADEFAAIVKDALGAPFVEYSDAGRQIKRVAVSGGSAGSFVKDAVAAGADAYLAGEFGYHNLCDSPDSGISLFAAGHFYTENPVCGRLFELTAEVGAMPIITFSNRIKSV